MTAKDIFGWLIIVWVLWLLVYSPILKPWFGFRRPKHPLPWHRWFR